MITFDFTHAVVLVTGGSQGIGYAIARAFADAGATVHITGTRASAADYQDDLSDFIYHAVQLQDKSAREALIAHFDRLDVLVNNAGRAGSNEYDYEQYLETMEVNLNAATHLCYGFRPLLETSGGAIVNTASVAGIRSGAGGNAYSASKAAVINLTKTAACDLGQYNVRVNAVCPGLIETGMTRRVFDYARENDKEHKLGSRCELRRYGRPEEIAAAIAFLASDDASYITGQALPVDGGNTASLNLPGMKV